MDAVVVVGRDGNGIMLFFLLLWSLIFLLVFDEAVVTISCFFLFRCCFALEILCERKEKKARKVIRREKEMGNQSVEMSK